MALIAVSVYCEFKIYSTPTEYTPRLLALEADGGRWRSVSMAATTPLGSRSSATMSVESRTISKVTWTSAS